METEGGGWTAIQKRISGSVSFNRTWTEYKKGFGNPNDSYWIGNDVIHQLTKNWSSSLYVSITLLNATTLYQQYQQFSVSDETDNYRLFLGGPATGTLGDSMMNPGDSNGHLSGMFFTTSDRDNDQYGGNCAAVWEGGWWFKNCYVAFLNGPWSPKKWTYPWYPTIEYGTSVKQTLMMFKRH
ncbi:ficolin-2-like [Saccostrea echinata]|uniref:ficolin-2-like n=1 Tax=Saccostrea echinata TaxID=191078 RepID=UPI002A8419FE|nr:ficolin-2-like [Saccostrea echinata]